MRAGELGRELDCQLMLADTIRDESVVALARNQLHIRGLDFIDLGLCAQQRNHRPLVRETLRFKIHDAAGLITLSAS